MSQKKRNSTGTAPVNVDELLASSAPILPRRITFHQARHPESMHSFRAKYTPINSASSSAASSSSSPSSSKMNNEQKNNGGDGELVEATLPKPKKNLYPKEKVYGMLGWKEPMRVGAGLHNVGNTCFLNSTLQCLTYCPPLANYALSRLHSKSCRRVGFCPMCAMERHIVGALKATAGAIVPKEIASHLRAIVKHFRLGRQEDAHEFLCYLLSGMHKSTLPTGEKLDPWTEQTSVVHRMFGGYLQSSVVCAACSYASNTFDSFLDLCLEIKHCGSVNDALIHFTKPETLDASNMYKCEKIDEDVAFIIHIRCSKRSRARKQLTIHEAPNVLAIQLKRFSYRSMFGGKISKFINYPAKLSLKPFMSKNQNDKNPTYDLYGVLVHSGYDTRAGHYYCFIKNSNGIWHEMNDSTRRQVSVEQVLKQQAYLLFYVRSPESVPSQPSGNESSESDQEVSKNKKRKRESVDENGGDHTKSPSSPSPNGKQMKAQSKSPVSPKSNGEDLGEAVNRKELGKKAQGKEAAPQNKKPRLSLDSSLQANGNQSQSQQKALDGFAAFNKRISENGQGKPKTAENGSTSPAAKENGVKKTAMTVQGKAKEAIRDADKKGDLDFANMSVDDLFAKFDSIDDNDENEMEDKPAPAPKKEPPAPKANGAANGINKDKKGSSTSNATNGTEASSAKPQEKSHEKDQQPNGGSAASVVTESITMDGESAAEATGKKKRKRRKRNKNASTSAGEASNGIVPSSVSTSSTDNEDVHPEPKKAEIAASGIVENGEASNAAVRQKRKREETTEAKSDDAPGEPAQPKKQKATAETNNDAAKSPAKNVVGSGRKDKVLTFDDLVYRRGKNAEPVVGKGKPSEGAKEWEQYLKQNATGSSSQAAPATHWDGVKGIDAKVAQQKQILQSAPELQLQKRQRDEWDQEYDKGRVKKSKVKPEAASTGANPFQNLQNVQRERKDAEKKGLPWPGGRGGGRGRGGRGGMRGRGGRGPMGGKRRGGGGSRGGFRG